MFENLTYGARLESTLFGAFARLFDTQPARKNKERTVITSVIRNCSLIIGVTLLQVSVSYASPILTGAVSQSGSLYTYSYTLDNVGPGPITEISVLVEYGNLTPAVSPLSHSDPPNWDFQMTFSGTIANPPYNENGSFWAWNSFVSPVSVGQTLSGFSFTTTFAPATTTSNNYFLFCASCGGDGIVEFGNVVAPDVVVPEPSLFWPAGLLAIAIILSKRTAYLRNRSA